MAELGGLWTNLRQDALGFGEDRLLVLALIGWGLLTLSVLSWLLYLVTVSGTRRRLRSEVQDLQFKLAEVQRKYDEVLWRTTAEDMGAQPPRSASVTTLRRDC